MSFGSVLARYGSNLGWKSFAVIFGFFAFVTILLTLGVASATQSLSIVIGMFIIVVALGGVLFGKIPYSSPVFMGLMVVGIFMLVVNPGEKFTIGDMLRTLGMVMREQVIAWI